MKMIFNWTIGSFFRTIGKFFALLFIGLIALLIFGKIDIKAYTFSDNNNEVNLTLPNTEQYFVLTRGFNAIKYNYLSSNTSFYYVCNYNYRNQNTYESCVGRNYKIEVSEEVFNSSNEFKYLDHDTNKYYIFTGNDGFDSWYYSTSNSWHHSSSTLEGILSTPNVDSYFYKWNSLSNDPYNKVRFSPYNAVSYNVTFHLNGGTAVFYNVSLDSPFPFINQDFTQPFYTNGDLYGFLNSFSVRNDIATFNQWYYDEELTQPYNYNDNLTSDINLYASYMYTSVDSVLSNISFNEFTFPSDKQYAVISVKENFSQGLYIGLGFNFQYLTAYTYIIENQAFIDGAGVSLSSIGSKNNYFYYHLYNLDNLSAKVIVIDKANLTRLGIDDVIEHYYTFRLSSNAYIEFTNDLTQISYYIPINNGSSSEKLENKDISSNYDYTQKFILDSNADITTMLLSYVKNANFGVFALFKQLWYKFRAYKILNYFLLIIVGSIVISFVKGGARH